MKHVKPYEKLALIYDDLMNHVDYKSWAGYLLQVFNYYKKDVFEMIDLSTGTASLLHSFNGSGMNLYGCDLSSDMIKKSMQKNNRELLNLFVSDVKNMAIRRNSFDAVVFLYDSFNYLMDKSQIALFLNETNRILKTGGILIFDVVTEYQCQEYYADFNESEFWNGRGYLRHSYYNSGTRRQHNDFTIIIDEETYYEKHEQSIYSQSKLEKILRKYNYNILGVLDGFTLNEAHEESERIHFVAEKV